MIVSVYVFNDDASAWDAFVDLHPASTSYHRYAWRTVIEKSFGHKTCYLVARSRDGEIRGILPLTHMKSALFGNFLVSLPFFNYGGLLCQDDTVAASLLDSARDLMKEFGADHVELRHLTMHEGALATRQHKVTMVLDLLKNVEEQWKALDAKVRNQVRKAEKAGLRAVTGQMELLDGFYEVFCRNMRDLGTPVYAEKFFRNILEAFPESTRIISITLDGRTVASGFLSWYRGTLEVPWASSIRDYRELCPNNLLYWEAIRFAIMNGSSKFDFGRSTPHEGTFNFKKQWGAMPVQLHWQYLLESGRELPEINPKNPKYEMAIKIWKKLPLAITRLIGPHIVRNIP